MHHDLYTFDQIIAAINEYRGGSQINLRIINSKNKKHMITQKTWEEFRKTGLLLIVNQFLHIFGWAIVIVVDADKITSVYPARVKFRGFDNDSTSEAYHEVSEYMAENAQELNDEARLTDPAVSGRHSS